MDIPQAAFAAPCDNEFFTRLGQVGNLLAGLVKEHDGTRRNLDDLRPSLFARPHAATAGATVFRLVMLHILERQQAVEIIDNSQDHVAATSAIAAIRPSLGDVLFTPE